jgi:SAM-dependent methyltransferase
LISRRLLGLVRCPDCHAPLTHEVHELRCSGCDRRFSNTEKDYLVLMPASVHTEQTKFLEERFHADGRDETVSPPLLSAAVRNTMLQKFLAPRVDDVVLDLGCGSGRFAVWNLSSGAHVVGVDTGTFFAAEARARVDLVVGELRNLPFEDGSVHKAYAIDVLEHLSEEGLDAMLREVARVLPPRGSLFVYTHVMQLSPLAPVLKGISGVARAVERAGLADLTIDRLRPTDHLNPLRSREHLDEVAARAGFRVARFRYYTPILSRIAESVLVPIAAHALARRRSKTAAVDSASLRDARLRAKERLAQRGIMYRALQMMTWLVMLDVRVLGRLRSGPFFALLVKEKP